LPLSIGTAAGTVISGMHGMGLIYPRALAIAIDAGSRKIDDAPGRCFF
jgi:hypothetical protein